MHQRLFDNYVGSLVDAVADEEASTGAYERVRGVLQDFMSDHEIDVRKKIADELRAEAERIENDG